ncbi:hypothetical protein [Gemmiger formicilis]|jgi:hypothetical protein|uniref:hypothetical protein n=1 Tax=Gemmiger formicilis TaxID=745368 RepID=UPI003FD8B272
MLKKNIKYVDYDGNERTEDFYFNLNKAEVIELQLGTVGGLTKTLEKIVQEKDTSRIIEYFKTIILKAYGEKSADGRRFIKSQELRDAFEQTEAYSELFMELARDAKMAAEFINGVLPKEAADAIGVETTDVNS